METVSSIVTAACWACFILYWIASALKVKGTAEQQSLPSALAHRIPVGLGFMLLICRQLPDPLNQRLTPPTNTAYVTGAAAGVLGLLITLWARRTLAGNWSSDVTFKQNHELIRTGPYRFVRHPIYTGLLVMCLGTAVGTGKLRCWLGILVVAVGFWIKLNQEERLLLRHFPEAYPAYRKQVKA